MSDLTPSYVELLTQTATKMVDAGADLAHRTIRSSQSLWEIASAPYGTSDVQAIVSANFDRVGEIATILADDMHEQLNATQNFNETMADQAVKFQDAYLNALRGLLDVGFSNISFVREAAAEQVLDLSHRFDAFKVPSSVAASAN